MKARPILFSAPMVRALLDGRKSQTRRVVKPQPNGAQTTAEDGKLLHDDGVVEEAVCPYGKPVDLLWVRESISHDWKRQFPGFAYMADHPGDPRGLGWTPSIHMPRIASRLTLELTGVRVERLQDISEADAMAEGDPHQGLIASENTHRDWYQKLWASINGTDSWDANPWVWVLSFDVHLCNVNELLKVRAA